MKIKAVEIYGYGQFVERKVTFNTHITQIFGENEAGKSTLQAFIHSILFGFPTKKESEPRLEPRMGNQYGGRITLVLDDNTEVEVERVKGRAQGDVKVYMPNGAIKDEAWLQQHLNYINKRTYQDIFSFNVLGLQDIHKHMSETQLQNFLMQAGALGSTEFIGMRDLIHKKKQTLYKKSGHQPEINQRISTLKELELEVRENAAQLETYNRLVETREKTANRLATVKGNLDYLTQFFEEKQKEVAIHEQVQEWKALEADLNIEPLTFPEQGIDRYEIAKQQLNQLERDRGLRDEKRKQLQYENDKLFVPEPQIMQAMNNIAKQEEYIKQQERELKQVSRDIENNQQEIEGLKSNIGWDTVHLDIDTSEVQKTFTSDALKKKREYAQSMERYQAMQDEYSIERQSYEDELKDLKSKLVTDDTFEKKKIYEKRMLELNEKRQLFEKMKSSFEAEKQEKVKRQNILRVSMGCIALITVALAIYAFLIPDLIFGSVFAVLTLICLIGMFSIKDKELGYNERFAEEITQLENEVENLEQTYDLNFELSDQYQLRDKIVQREQNLAISEKKYTHIQKQLETSQNNYEQVNNQIVDIRKSLYLSDKMSDDLLLDAIQTIQQIKTYHDEQKKLRTQQEQLNAQIATFYNNAEQSVGVHFSVFNRVSLFHDVREWIKHAQTDTMRYEQNREQFELISNEIKQLEQRISEKQSTIQKLFNTIGAIDEESYYKHHDRYQSYQQALSRFNDLTHFLENQDYGYEKSSQLSEKTAIQLEGEYDKLEEQIDDYNDRYLTLQSEVSDLTAQINHMETDDTLRHLKHQYQLKRNQLNSLAEDWAALSYLETLVDAHIKQIKDKRLPQVVHEATDIYATLTEGQYVKVTYENEEVMVRHKDGQMYHPVELSQSTKELLYFALRISLIKVLKPYYSLPIIIDDAFVHFDEVRKKRMMSFLRTLPNTYQVLYFTCNQDGTLPAKQTVTLSKLEK
ncbi:AAA family ATPase [Staphylococcus sp. 17KM0847]|uniref:ATP-binding protein n=1 Tax=Staphylococcus sp. 17KM0847 TaxID=2583989 RepID=UPI0015DC915B|nr:AAA family ATPase [Staphylococcus sp. 17KM0847]QLK86977.1 DNA repair protein Rad50 [Staphylococcus sp. 17KM0847]